MNAYLEELFSKPRQVRAARRALQQHMRALLEEAKQPRRQKTQQGRTSTRHIHRWIDTYAHMLTSLDSSVSFSSSVEEILTSFTDRPHK